MSKPMINVVRVLHAVTPPSSNNVQVTLEDQAGLKRTLNLSPPAQEAMVMACMARMPFRKRDAAGSGQMREIHARNLSLFESQEGLLGLEIEMSSGSALHFLLSESLKAWLLEELPRFCAEPSRKPH